MARVLVIPDSHLNVENIERGVELAKKKFADHIVLLGDYFDNWDATYEDYEKMAKYLKNLLRTNPIVVPLYGNHELSYIDPLRFRASGYRGYCADIVTNCVKNDHRFLYAFALDGVLYSHAGVTKNWLKYNRLLSASNIRLALGPSKGANRVADVVNGCSDLGPLGAVGPRRGGSSVPGPLWCDASELDLDPAGNFTQVVGHTPVERILHLGNIWFTDVRSNGGDSDEYLFVNDGKPEIIRYSEVMNGK